MTALRMRTAIAAVCGLGLIIAGCGSDAARRAPATPPHGAALIAAQPYAPGPELERLVDARARARGTELVQREGIGTAPQLAQLSRDLSPSSGLRTVIVAPVDAAATARVVARRSGRSPEVVGLFSPVAGAARTIELPEARIADRLAAGAARWAAAHGGIADATVVAPPADPGVADWSVPIGQRLAPLLASRLEDAGFSVTTVTALGAADAAGAVAGAPSPVLIAWSDAVALAAAAELPREHWIGAAGTPSPSGAATERALRSGELQLVTGAQLSDVADAIVAASAAGGVPAGTSPASRVTLLPLRSFTARHPR